jgi:hypothetical protein
MTTGDIAGVFVSSFFLLIALYFMARSRSNNKLEKETQSWESTEGKITRSEVPGRSLVPSPTSGGYKFICNFDYQVDGMSFTGVGPYLDVFMGYKYEAEALSSQYSVGKKVMVYYDPTSPSRSCLIRSCTGETVKSIMFCVFCLAISILLWHFDILD